MVEQAVRGGLAALVILLSVVAAQAAPYAAYVVDARNGKVLLSQNANQRLHPASLTKMMTLYVVFREIEEGRMSLGQKVKISRYAATRPPSRLGLKVGQRVTIQELIRATSVKSANDAAAALAEAVSGSEPAFARKMTEIARVMGMSRTTFRNASGLTQAGHLSTARDMTVLGRRLFFDFPQYYNLFSRKTTSTTRRTVYNTNRKFLRAYRGADGIKTGYTVAAGYNLVASARRGNERIIATVFGEKSTAKRNARMARLLDLGFRKAPTRVAIVRPAPLHFAGDTLLAKSVRPKPRPGLSVVAMARNIPDAVTEDTGVVKTPLQMAEAVAQALENAMKEDSRSVAAVAPAQARAKPPRPRPRRAGDVQLAALQNVDQPVETSLPAKPVGSWSVNLGAYSTRNQAERLLLKTALQDLEAFDGALRQVEPTRVKGAAMFRARFVGLSQRDAQNACARLIARASDCVAVAPGS